MNRAQVIAAEISKKQALDQLLAIAKICRMADAFIIAALFSSPNTCAGRNLRRLAVLYGDIASILLGGAA